MRGRDVYRLVRPVLAVISGVLGLVPRRVLEGLWPFLDLLPEIVGIGARYAFAARLAKGVGEVVRFGRGVEVVGWRNLQLGNHVSVHKGCYLDATGDLSIGDDVSIAHACSFLTVNHGWSDPSRPIRENSFKRAPVVVANDVWIGCGVRILPGVSIGNRSVVAAGAVVTKNVNPRTIVGGVPAREIGHVE